MDASISTPASVHDAGAMSAAASAPPKPQSPCDALFIHGEVTSPPTPVGDAARRFYVAQVVARKLDLRHPSQHPFFLTMVGGGTGKESARCVEDWASTCPHCVVPGGSKAFVDGARYDLVKLAFNDAGDGEYEYVFFIDGARLQVVAAFRETNFVP
ncbi:Hypothetical protein A7982_01628 [Minicystis rosea]|nr:Hypothetical protein A7982_01628 [Minicystis rosea]